ncbi:MAG: hypothetical protein JKY60_15250 [Kordiimonadaceae bacterium]|nr:hypothetical protein [Kordiimonadaceae bacterium]
MSKTEVLGFPVVFVVSKKAPHAQVLVALLEYHLAKILLARKKTAAVGAPNN